MNVRTMFAAGAILTAIVVFAQANNDKGLPDVLIIGDSISIGYTKPLIEILAGQANVVHNPGNARHSALGLARLDEWLGETDWDVIHFNHGLHDLKFVNADSDSTHIQIPVKQYEKNMEAIVIRLKQTGAKLIFATTTPYPDDVGPPRRDPGEAERYNLAALIVMKQHDVAVNDLYTYILPQLNELQKIKNVHFKSEGYYTLAQEVARNILAALADE